MNPWLRDEQTRTDRVEADVMGEKGVIGDGHFRTRTRQGGTVSSGELVQDCGSDVGDGDCSKFVLDESGEAENVDGHYSENNETISRTA